MADVPEADPLGGAPAAPADTPAPATVTPEGTDTLAAVRLTGGLGSAMVIGSSVMASSMANSGKCSEVVGSMSVGLLGTMLMFGGMMPMTQGLNTNVVWVTGMLEFLLILFIAITIIRLLALAKACPALSPDSKDCGSGTRRGMAKVATGLSLSAILYMVMALPDYEADEGASGLFGAALKSSQGLSANLHAAATAPLPAAADAAPPAADASRFAKVGATLARHLPRIQALLKVLSEEIRGVFFVLLGLLFFGLGIGLPFAGINDIASACRRRTAD
jgi:hypothetical protein